MLDKNHQTNRYLAIRLILIISGTLAVGLGILGIFLPVLPTTPFLLLAAACYARSSERFYSWLLNNPWFGEYIRNYREGKGVRLRHKLISITLLWLLISYSALFVVPHLWVKIILYLIAVAVTIHLLLIKTYKPDEKR